MPADKALKIVQRDLAEVSLYEFVQKLWHVVEPDCEFVHGWHMEAICEHLEAVTYGDVNRLLINVSPGAAKSLLVCVFWPAWEWLIKPSYRYVCFSYAAQLTERDNRRFNAVISSPLYQEWWKDKFTLVKAGETYVENNKTGWKMATSVRGVGTGARGDRVLIDDPHNIKDIESDTIRNETTRWFRESITSRVNDQKKSAIVVIMQRVHERDVSGAILDENMGYEHLCIPCEYDPTRHCRTSIGWSDPREEYGELYWPDRYPQDVVEQLKKDLGPFAAAGQYQQSPTPRGGGIIKSEWWQLWDEPQFPMMEYIVASLDPAYTEKQENDYSGFSVFGVWRNKEDLPKLMLMHAWEKRLTLHGPARRADQDKDDRTTWGLVEWVAHTCKRFKIDKLLIEDKASGHSVAQEIKRLYSDEGWSTQLVTPKGDKVARMYRVEPIFADGVVYAPDRDWAQLAIDRTASFPKGHDDLPDSISQAISWLRDTGWALRRDERERDLQERATPQGKMEPIYDL